MRRPVFCSIALSLLVWLSGPAAANHGTFSAKGSYQQNQSTHGAGDGRAVSPGSSEQRGVFPADGPQARFDFPETELSLTGHTLSDVQTLEQQCFDEVNRQRSGERLRPLELSPGLLPVARFYSRRMAEEKFFSHRDPDGHTVRQRVTEAGVAWKALGENLALNKGYVNPVACSVKEWMDSPGHRENILNSRYNFGAVGVWIAQDGTIYFTQIFLAK